MQNKISRRDFLKLAGMASLGSIIPPSVQNLKAGSIQGEKKNVLIVVFDSLTAKNISLFGYGRENMPNLTRLANRATVFHNHYASGNFTTPATASLLTGTIPWTHRAIRFRGTVKQELANKSIFHAFDDYYRTGYSHNTLADALLEQFSSSMEGYIPQEKYFLFNDGPIQNTFNKDADIATIAWARDIKREEGFSYSLFLPYLYEKYRDSLVKDVVKEYPYGLPTINLDNFYLFEECIRSLTDQVINLPQPFLSYLHFFPPHFPYKPHQDFAGAFQNGPDQGIPKPDDIFTEGDSFEKLEKWKRYYDEFILNVDHEFGLLFDKLESSGVLDDTWVIFTADHGEMFERGIQGHTTVTLYQPIVHIPLLIFEPGKQTRQDIYSPTSAIDLMPTLLHLTGHEIPETVEGSILPPYANAILTPQKNLGPYTVQARYNDVRYPLTQATVMHIVDNYKMVYYLGYEELGSEPEKYLLFDIEADPEEMTELSQTKRETATELLNIIRTKLKESNDTYTQ